ncbi:MAG: UDP-glucose 4-epimerase GalE [Chlamydia sp. 32-24]|nr:MAG: UDP-glucose 4-epimerase GalE [Chlamydia sp. 32-24]
MKIDVLVVGGAGYIGSNIVKLLKKRNYNPIVLDNLSTGDERTLLNATFYKGELADKVLLKQIFKTHNIKTVFHFAALINVGESVKEPSQYYKNNVCDTLFLLDAMREYNIKYFIFSSSAAVYGTPSQVPIKESSICNPINPYGQSKLMIEKILADFDVAYGLKSSCLRYFNAAGGDPEGAIKNYQAYQGNLIPRVLRSLKKLQGSVIVYGNDYPTPDGTCIRDYIHVWDLAEAHIKAMEQLWNQNKSTIYNLGNGQGYSVLEVIKKAEEITGKKLTFTFGNRREGDPVTLIADASLAYKELEWTPKYSDLDSMIAHAWTALEGHDILQYI